MKKDKEWLKSEVENILCGIELRGQVVVTSEGSSIYYAIEGKIDELDEPEVKQLDKKIKLLNSYNDELIRDNNQLRNELDNHYSGKPFVYVDNLQNLLVPKQDKQVIPQFVADWYEESLSGGYTDERNKFSGNDVFRVIKDVLETNEGFRAFENYGIGKKIATWAEENEEDFIHLIVNCSYKEGYEVEKEPVYYAKIKGHELVGTEIVLDDTGNDVTEFHRNIYFVLQKDGELVIDMKDSGYSGAKHFMTMSQWNNLGINETNADFEEGEL